MFLQIISLILYKLNYKVGENSRDFYLPITFGFNSGGNYSIKIKSDANDKILIHIGTIDDIKHFWSKKDQYHPCNISISNESIYILNNKNYSFTGIIQKAGKYAINIKSCTYFSSKYSIELTFLNPTSALSSENQYYLNTFKKLILFSLFLCILWFITILVTFSDTNIYHLLISIVLFLYTVDKILLFFEYKSLDQSVDITKFSIVRPYIVSIYFLFLYSTIMLALSGYLFSYSDWRGLVFFYNFLVCLVLIYLKSSFYFFIVLMIPFVVYIWHNIEHSFRGTNQFNYYFFNSFIFLIHSLSTAFIRKKSLNQFNIQAILNMIDFCFLLYLSYQFQKKINSDHLNRIQSLFNDYIEVFVGKAIIIPSNITTIYSFQYHYHCFQKVIFQKKSNLKIIGEHAFDHCHFNTIVIPSSVETISSKVFDSCYSLEKVEFEPHSKLMIIDSYAFHQTIIASIVIPSSVIQIFEGAFCECTGLKKIEFEENSQLQIIGASAFRSTAIKSIEIPDNVVFIDINAFEFCRVLKTISFKNSNLQKICESTFAYSGIETLTIPRNVCCLENAWCYRTYNLNDVNISPENEYFQKYDNKMIIGKKSNNKSVLYFAPRNINSITIPSFIKHIEECSFEFCKQLTKVDFEENSQLSIINSDAFSCTHLYDFTFPSSVLNIGNNAFNCCNFLTRVDFPDDSQLESIGCNAFYETPIHRILIPSKVTRIHKFAFCNCYNLVSVDFKEDSNLKIIGFGAFENSFLNQIIIPPSVFIIKNCAFSRCYYLQIVEIPENSKLKKFSKEIFDENSPIIVMIPVKFNIKNL